MPKTYGTVTTFTAGSVLTAAQLNVASTAVNNLVVPPTCQVIRSSNLTSYTTNADVTWNSAAWDTDGMFAAGSPTRVTIQTAGVYVISWNIAVSATATLTNIAARVRLNGGSDLGFAVVPAYSTTSAYTMSSITHSFAAADYLTFGVLCNGGSNYSVQGNATLADYQTRLTVAWVGRTS